MTAARPSAGPRQRVDEALVDRGLAASRSQARRLILAGQVRSAGQIVDKPGTPVAMGSDLEVEQPPRFVSRGGDKLAPVLAESGVAAAGRNCIDIGASAGGFTDCLLQAGATLVVAVDVGYGQLDWRLRNDARVRVMERTNARHLVAADLPDDAAPLSVLVMDASFISVAKVLPAVTRLCAAATDALILVKPQFEAGPDEVEKGGVVRSAAVRRRTVRAVAEAAAELGWSIPRAWPSPLRGPAGNWECFLQLRLDGTAGGVDAAIRALDVPEDRGAP